PPTSPLFPYTTLFRSGTAGLHGAWFEQIIKTGGKLKVAEASATMDFLNAQLALRKAQADLAAQVRAGYFGMLVARRNLQISRARSEEHTSELQSRSDL